MRPGTVEHSFHFMENKRMLQPDLEAPVCFFQLFVFYLLELQRRIYKIMSGCVLKMYLQAEFGLFSVVKKCKVNFAGLKKSVSLQKV